MRGYQSLAAAGGLQARSAHVPGPLSADDIRKERERKAAQARLQQLRAKEAGGAAAAPAAAAPATPGGERMAAAAAGAQQQGVPAWRSGEPAAAAPKRQRSDSGAEAAERRQGVVEQPSSPKRSRPPAADGAPPRSAQQPAGSQQQQQQQQQPAWLPPPDITLPPPGPNVHHRPAWGEDSTEARRRAQARSYQPRSTEVEVAAPLVPQAAPTQQPPAMPYVPVDPVEAREEDEKLRAAGWRPPGAAH